MARFGTLVLAVLFMPALIGAQERGAIALGEALAGLDVTPRVLMIGAHPDDEDTQLIAFLARGRHVETGYLSLTRGDGGQNLIGNELGVQLGMIRTEELLAARRIDGGRQFFTRAFDFGFSKTAEETYRHWPRDSILRDVVTVVRAFRPQVIIAVFSGTPRDGHGHHQVSGILAREVFDAAADTIRFPRSATLGLGAWTPSKFYRASRFAPTEASASFNVGELSALRGRTYAEIASLSRSQHLSQGFGQLERRGATMDFVKLEASRVGEVTVRETSVLDGIAAGWSRFRLTPRPALSNTGNAALDTLPSAIARARSVANLADPHGMVAPLAEVVRLLQLVRDGLSCSSQGLAAACEGTTADLALSVATSLSRAKAALLSAAGVQVEATAPRDVLAVGESMPVTISVYNQGMSDVTLVRASAATSDDRGTKPLADRGLPILPDSAGSITSSVTAGMAGVPWWLENTKHPDVFVLPSGGAPHAINLGLGEDRVEETKVSAVLRVAGVQFEVAPGPVVNRFADPARGELRRPVSFTPKISVLFDNEIEYARANSPFDRTYTLRLHSSSASPASVTVTLSAPGLTIDSATRHVALEPFTDASVPFHVQGTYAPGRHVISAAVTSGAETFSNGFVPIQYAHIRPLRYYRPAIVQVEAVQAELPRNADIAYVRGVGDNVAPMLAQLGLHVTMLTAEQLAAQDLSQYRTIVVGPRAFAADRELVAQARKLNAFALNGGTVVMQYGQQEIQTPGILPYPVTLNRTAERVTVEEAPVTVLDAKAGILSSPNRISESDFTGWVQERSTYMPTTADPHYQQVLEMHDPGEPANRNALLVAPVGKGAYVYATLALFRQLPAGVPGPARLFLNILTADGKTSSPVLQP